MEQVTLIKSAIHRPDEPRHFMEYSYPNVRCVATLNNHVIGDSKAVLKLSEVGYHIYDPVIYFPLADLNMTLLRRSAKTSHCPLKGDTHYYDFVRDDSLVEAVGWCYSAPLDFAKTLATYAAFDSRIVTITRHDEN
ncbi:MAG: DUF427 domain-containing protein [Proteobacteria bacterium]|nr:DUF427 domain-containing protein [Pseudomonadota bacterium]